LEETRIYASYLARLTGFLLVLILLGLVIWFVVSLGDDNENGVVTTPDEQNATTSVTDQLLGDNDVIVVDSNTNRNDSLLSATDTEISNTTSNNIPDTGPMNISISAIAIGLVIISGRNFLRSRSELQESLEV
jgi:predicted PurR-regulated permease PerM